MFPRFVRPLQLAAVAALVSVAVLAPVQRAGADEPGRGGPPVDVVRVGPPVTPLRPTSEVAVDTPAGPAVVRTRLVSQPSAPAGIAAGGSATCISEFLQPSFRFTIFTPWRWDYRSVTWMGATSYSSWALPLFWWDSMQTYNDWASGWQYAWGNGRATMKYGAKPIGVPLFSVHLNTLVDAWGNCTPEVRVRWF